jgi:hypothetical protein
MSEIANKIRSVRWQQLVFILLIGLMVAGTEGCKSSGKLSKKERKAQIENAKKQLQPIINGTSTLSLEEQQRLVNSIRDKNYKDATLDALVEEAQVKLKSAFAEQEKIRAQKIDVARAALYDMILNKDDKSADELEKELAAIKAQKLNDSEINDLIFKVEKKIDEMRGNGGGAALPLKTRLENAFNTIVTSAGSGDLDQANATIAKTLPLFVSEKAPVLIIIYREKGKADDFDEPTTIIRYLNLLKDTKANRNNIDAIKTDSRGKITELDLIKK